MFNDYFIAAEYLYQHCNVLIKYIHIQQYEYEIKSGPGLQRYFHVKIDVSSQAFSSLACDWLAAQPPTNQKASLKFLVYTHGFERGFFSL